MKTQEFLQLLETNKDKSLVFEYAPNQFVGANYHITEVKHIAIDSVDCGARMDAWNETVIQLWESPSEIDKVEYMTANKALGIMNTVGSMKAYNLNSEVKFEYGNAQFHTAQLFVNNSEIRNGQLVLALAVEKTDCKAKEACGVPESEAKTTEAACCTPSSGCC